MIFLTKLQNSTNIEIRNITCRGGNGIAIGSLGQYVNMVSTISRAPSMNYIDVTFLLARLCYQRRDGYITGLFTLFC